MSKEMWLPSGIVDCDNFKEEDITFDNLANLCYTQRAWANITELRWPVSNHAYLSAVICSHLLRNGEWDDVKRYASVVFTMFHDCEEVYVTDIPTPFKSDEIKAIGDNIRNMIFNFLGVNGMDENVKSAVDLADTLSLFWEVKHGYKHWKDVGIDCIKPVLARRCKNIIYHGINPSSVKETIEWVGVDDLISWGDLIA